MRTKNSIKNAISSIIFNLIIGILGFVKVKVFVNGFTTDVYSFNQLLFQIMGYIAIADIGFGLLLNKKLYDALAKDDKDEVNKIYSTSKVFYKYIGIFMFSIAFIISFFIKIFTKADLSPEYMQIVFIIFAIRNIVDYFFIAPKFVLESDQKYYLINHLVKGIRIIETVIEIILVLLGVDYLFVIIPGIFISILMNIYINKKIYKIYNWLEDTKIFNKKYLKGTRDVVVQKITGLVNSNTDIILLSTFVTPISVVIYTSYSYITKFLIDMLYMVSAAITPSYANVINKDDTEKSYNVFRELNTIFMFIATFITIMLYGLFNSFITLWIGSEYVVDNITLLMFCFIAFQKIAERAVIIMINSKGLFKETKSAILIESILNVVLSLFLINKFGILGVLIGTVLSKVICTNIQEPVYIYKNIFKKKCYIHFLEYFFNIMLVLIAVFILNSINISVVTLIDWIIYAVILAIIVIVLIVFVYTISFNTFRIFLKRIYEFVKFKGNYR